MVSKPNPVVEIDFNKIDKNLIADLYGIFYQINLWLGKGGSLDNIDIKNKRKLDIWMKIYSYAIALLLEYTGQSYEEAFYEYEDYLEDNINYE